jgi:hypothetical protein
MTQDAPNSPSQPKTTRLPSRLSWVWKVLAIIVVLGGALVAADFFHSVGGGHGQGRDGKKPSGGLVVPPPDPDELPPGDVPGRAAGEANLRRIMADLVLNAVDEDTPFRDPANKDPEERQKTVADFLRLPYKDLGQKAPADLVPPSGRVIASFENPGGGGEKMVLVRMNGKVGAAISAFYTMYTAAGWKAPDLEGARAQMLAGRQTDEGWLIRFARPGGQERIIYARERSAVEETLVAVYDSSR